MTDRVSDMLIRIKNAYLARHKTLSLPYFSLGGRLAKILSEKGYLGKVEIEKSEEKKNKFLRMDLVYHGKKPVVLGIKIISKPGLRVYTKAKKIKRVLGGEGVSIISTPSGLMSGDEARKKNLGGEMICEIW